MIRQKNIVWKQLHLDIITRSQLSFKQIPKSVVPLRPTDMHTNGVIAKNRRNYWANSNGFKNNSLSYYNKQTQNYSQSITHNVPRDQKNKWPIYQIKIYPVKVNYWNFLSIHSFIFSMVGSSHNSHGRPDNWKNDQHGLHNQSIQYLQARMKCLETEKSFHVSHGWIS